MDYVNTATGEVVDSSTYAIYSKRFKPMPKQTIYRKGELINAWRAASDPRFYALLRHRWNNGIVVAYRYYDSDK